MSSGVPTSTARSPSPMAGSTAKPARKSSTSSSRPRSRPSPTSKAKISRCVMCGSKRIKVKAVDVPAPRGAACTVEAEVCMNCGQRCFTRAAAEAILASGKRRHTRKAAR